MGELPYCGRDICDIFRCYQAIGSVLNTGFRLCQLNLLLTRLFVLKYLVKGSVDIKAMVIQSGMGGPDNDDSDRNAYYHVVNSYCCAVNTSISGMFTNIASCMVRFSRYIRKVAERS